MMSPKAQTISAITAIGLSVSLAISLIPTKPESSIAVLVTLSIFMIVWKSMSVWFTKKTPDQDWYTSKSRHTILFSIILASLLLLGSLVMTFAKQLELLDADTIKRIIGINTGIMLTVLGNYMPKNNIESCSCTLHSKSSKKTQRFLGWTFVLAGIAYIFVWSFVKLENATIAILFTFPIAIAVILLTRMIYKFSTKQSQQPI